MGRTRVVERPVSPSSTTNRSSTNSSSSSSCSSNSKYLGKPRRSHYRLFPSVEPTPPASPTSLHHQQRASLKNSSTCGSSLRRRSSSEDNGRGARDGQLPLPPHALANPYPVVPPSNKEGRKGSAPELSLLWTVQENGSSDIASDVRSGTKPGLELVEGSEGSKRVRAYVFNNVFDSDGDCAVPRQSQLEGTPTAPSIGLGLDMEVPTVRTRDNNDPTLSQGYVSARSKPRPNLRIAIVKQTSGPQPTSPPNRPSSPPVTSINPVGRWADLPSLASRFNSRAAAPEPYVRLPPEHQATYAIRPALSQAPSTSSASSFSTLDYSETSRNITPELSARSALAAARANVAALAQADVPTWNSSFSEQNKTPSSDLGSLHSRPSNAGVAGPLQTLAELAEQVDVLHARYASLRAQRQQLSSSIIADLESQASGASHGDTLLNEQLSLAAVSSSIDICFAKLKSLECLREDAIATLVAQATAVRRPSNEAATASRKSSLVPSLDSGSRLATGRSTPDLHALYRSNQPGPIKVHTYKGEPEGQQVRSPLYSQRSHPAHESNTDTDMDHTRHQKRLTQIRAPEATSESSGGTTVPALTADETDGNQISDPSDIEDMLPEELVRKPQRTDANGNSSKTVKILGLRPSDAAEVSPMSFRADAMMMMKKKKKKKPRAPLKLELHLDADFKSGLDDASPLTASTLNADDPDQLARDLELQLQSFPSAPARSSQAPTERNPRHDSPVHRSDTGKSNASAYTINVYLDESQEDLPPIP